MVAGELDGPFGPRPGRLDHPGPVRVVQDQFTGHLEGGPAGAEAGTPVGQQGVQPVPFGVGLLGQPAQVDRQRLGLAHQGGEPGLAERRVGVAAGHRALHVRDQPGVRGPRGRQHGLVRVAAGTRAETGGQAADGTEQRLRHRRADLVERLHGRVRDLRPGGEVRVPRRLSFPLRRVVPVVAGQVQLAEMVDRVPAVQLEPGVADPLLLLRRGQVSLVVRVRQRFAARPRRLQPGQAGPDARGRQVLRLAVVFVPSCELACLGDVEVADGAHPRGQVHAGDAIRRRGVGIPSRSWA